MTVETVLSIVAILGTVVVALINHLSKKKIEEAAQRNQKENQESIALLKSRLEEKKAEKDARRDYIYGAQKRLYKECEPFFFLLNEMAETALHRIYSLARTARDGNLGENGWLRHEGYYLKSTLYKLISPLTIFKLMQNRLTFIDLSVDPNIKTRYELIKKLYYSFSHDFELAGITPKLEYSPDVSDAIEKRIKEPEKYWRQGLYTGRLDNAVDSLIVESPEKAPRCMSFGEFESLFEQQGSNTRKAFEAVRDAFVLFHPKTRPVLWRVLITQSYLYLALIRSCTTKEADSLVDLQLIRDIPKKQREEFEWRSSKGEASDGEVLVEPFEVAKKYFEKHLNQNLNWEK